MIFYKITVSKKTINQLFEKEINYNDEKKNRRLNIKNWP